MRVIEKLNATPPPAFYDNWALVPYAALVRDIDGDIWLKCNDGSGAVVAGSSTGACNSEGASAAWAPFTPLPNAALVLDYREGGDA